MKLLKTVFDPDQFRSVQQKYPSMLLFLLIFLSSAKVNITDSGIK